MNSATLSSHDASRPVGIGGGRERRRQAPPRRQGRRLGAKRESRGAAGAAPGAAPRPAAPGRPAARTATRPATSGRSQPSAAQAAGERRHRRDVGHGGSNADIGPVRRAARHSTIRASGAGADRSPPTRERRQHGEPRRRIERRQVEAGAARADVARQVGDDARPAGVGHRWPCPRRRCTRFMSANRAGRLASPTAATAACERQAQVDVGAAARAHLPGGARQQVGAHRAQRRRKVDVAERRARGERRPPGHRSPRCWRRACARPRSMAPSTSSCAGPGPAAASASSVRQTMRRVAGQRGIEAQVGGDVAQAGICEGK